MDLNRRLNLPQMYLQYGAILLVLHLVLPLLLLVCMIDGLLVEVVTLPTLSSTSVTHLVVLSE